MTRTLGPNTQLPAGLIRERVLIAGGEDRDEIQEALVERFDFSGAAHHRFRDYECWSDDRVSVIRCGIGTGSVEPLVYELLNGGRTDRAGESRGETGVERIVLFGTSGVPVYSRLEVGEAYVVAAATPFETALNSPGLYPEPVAFEPNWPAVGGRPFAASISTDRYYGDVPDAAADVFTSPPRTRVLIEMEVAQFYHFARRYAIGDPPLFLAVKGVSNRIGRHAEHAAQGPAALRNAAEMAHAILFG